MTYAEGIKKKRCLERESIMSLVIKIMKERCVIVIDTYEMSGESAGHGLQEMLPDT